MKRYLVTLLLLAITTVSHAQTILFHDLTDLVTLSVPQLDIFLVQNGKFKIKDKAQVDGQIITYYQSIDKNKKVLKGEKMIAGLYRKTPDGTELHTITYQTIYPEYIFSMMKEMEKYGYHLSFKGIDHKQRTFIYDNPLNHIKVSMLNDHSINSVEVRQKELEIDK